MEEKHRTLVFDRTKVTAFERIMKTLITQRISFAVDYDCYGVDLISFNCDDIFYKKLINTSDFKGSNYCRE